MGHGRGGTNFEGASFYVINWFERARAAVAFETLTGESYRIEERMLSAIFQFAKAMPLLFVHPHTLQLVPKNERDRID